MHMYVQTRIRCILLFPKVYAAPLKQCGWAVQLQVVTTPFHRSWVVQRTGRLEASLLIHYCQGTAAATPSFNNNNNNRLHVPA